MNLDLNDRELNILKPLTLFQLVMFLALNWNVSISPLQAKPTLKSGLLLDRFDRDVRPQDDLYRFVNGRWLDTFKLPPEKSRFGIFNELHERSREQLKTIVLELGSGQASRSTQSPEALKVSSAYKAFMDEKEIEARDLEPIAALIQQLEQLPKEKLTQALGSLWRLGISGPIYGWIDQDAKSPTEYLLYLTQAGLGLPDRDYYLNDEEQFKTFRENYTQYLAQLFTMAQLDQPEERARLTLELETNLARSQWTRAESRQREKTYNKMTLSELNAEIRLDWSSFFATLSPRHHERIQALVLRQPSFFQSLASSLDQEPLRAWQSYLVARTLSHYAPHLSQKWVDLHFKFYGVQLSGKEKNEPRWKRGIEHVEAILGEALGKIYVERHFKPEAKAKMEQLVANLLVAFKGAVDGLEWMSPVTKKAAHEKLKRFTVKIGYPSQWRDYSALEVDAKDHIGNLDRAAQFEVDRELDKLGKPIDRQEWFMPPQMVNAYYNPSMNEIVFPAAILQPPFFDMEADDAVNYGGIGAVIGHEISHGFDDQGRKSDGDGRLTDWWTKEDAGRFQKRAQQLVGYYAQFEPVKGMKVNGELTLGENIGDLGGLTIAHRAYLLSLQNKEAPILDGFTGVQRVFLSWAQVWACQYREEELRRRVLTDPHSPAMYRVSGIVSQMPEFYQAFDVKEGDKHFLPADQRVKIW